MRSAVTHTRSISRFSTNRRVFCENLHTKNPARYLELDHLALLPHESNFWYGSTVANMDAVGMYVMQGVNINSFWSMEPLLGPVDLSLIHISEPTRRS